MDNDIPSLKVSILIPARNEEKNLPALLASLDALDFPPEQRETLVIDHYSIDNTQAIARQFGVQVLNATGKTISSVRNFAAASASGEILAFVDADCTVAPDWLRRALPYFDDPHVGLVGSHYVIPVEPVSLVRQVRKLQAMARPELVEGRWVPAGNMLIRREVFQTHGGFDETLVTSEDVDLCYRIARTHRVIADKRIRCCHAGEPKTLVELFRKELWRGRANYQGVAQHGLIVSELPSLILPIYFSVVLLAFVGSLLQGMMVGTGGVSWTTFWCAVAFVLPLLAFAIRIGILSNQIRYIPHCALFFGTYFIARGLAPLYTWKHSS